MEVRRLRTGEGERIRELRLRALREAPYAFSSSAAQEESDPLTAWEDLARRSERARTDVVFVAVDGERWVGMAGGYLHEDDAEAAGLWGMWVDRAARGGGVARELLDAVAGWARARGAARLELSVSDGAAAAAALYRASGFAPTGVERRLASDPCLTEIVLSRSLVTPDSRPA